jgi:hypothetical protein
MREWIIPQTFPMLVVKTQDRWTSVNSTWFDATVPSCCPSDALPLCSNPSSPRPNSSNAGFYD